jgi:mRNA interferase RelE/StbE
VSLYRPDIPPHVAAVIRDLHPELKRTIKAAVRAITADPSCGVALVRELRGFMKYRVRRFRIVYAVDKKTRTIRLVAVGHRQTIYEQLAERLRS